MPEEDSDNRLVPTPFKSLIAGWSIVVAVLAVAGYSFRWNYYYNFGLQSLVLTASVESLPVYAIELIRSPLFAVDVARLALLFVVPYRVVLLLLRRAREARRRSVRDTAGWLATALGLDNPLLREAITATLLILVAFRSGGNAGYRAYLANVVESTSRLPKVTVVARSDSTATSLPFVCDTRTLKNDGASKDSPFIGEPDAIESLVAGRACSTTGWSWRLLLRDEKFLYLFATVQDGAIRPATLVLPNTDELAVVFR